MGVLFIVAAETAAGKTAICAGLAINFLNDGKKVGYLQPPASEKTDAAGDIAFMKQIPGLDIVGETGYKGKDIVLAEGSIGFKPDDAVSQAAYAAAKEMKAKVIAVETYSGGASGFLEVYKEFGKNFLGVIINKVPPSQLARVRDEAKARWEAAGIKLLGVIPENRVLLAITVGELAESLKGRILNSPEKSAELVENYMLGALVVDSGLDYFGRKSRKAAIIHYDRPDMQLAALETSTACLVLSGSPDKAAPINDVLYKAQSRATPIIATGADINDIVNSIEGTLKKTRLSQAKKLDKLAEAVRQNLDMKA